MFNEEDDLSTEDDGLSVFDGHGLTEDGYPKIAQIAYAKHILGVEPNASEEEIKKAYFAKSLEYHPDLCDTGDEEHFKILTKAYQTFMNQKIVTTQQIHYENIIRDEDFELTGRINVYKGRKFDNEDSFFGRDVKQMFKPKGGWIKKAMQIGSDLQQEVSTEASNMTKNPNKSYFKK